MGTTQNLTEVHSPEPYRTWQDLPLAGRSRWLQNRNLSTGRRVNEGLQIAEEQGEDTRGFHVFPVTERHVDGQVVREHSAVPLKTLKDPKQACTTYGPTAPFTLAMLEGFQGEALPPSD